MSFRSYLKTKNTRWNIPLSTSMKSILLLGNIKVYRSNIGWLNNLKSIVSFRIESHGGIGAEFSKYLEEARIYIKDSYSDIDTLQCEGCQRSAFRSCIDIISIYTCKANTILFDNIRHGYYKRTTPRETGHFDLVKVQLKGFRCA